MLDYSIESDIFQLKKLKNDEIQSQNSILIKRTYFAYLRIALVNIVCVR
jgi:hypothetical protein